MYQDLGNVWKEGNKCTVLMKHVKATNLTVQFEKPGQSPGNQGTRRNKQTGYQLKPHKAFTNITTIDF